MSTIHRIIAKIVFSLLFLILCAGGALSTAHGQTTGNWTNVPAYLDGACEVPPNSSAYTGTAGLSYNLIGFNPANNTSVTVRVTLPPDFSAVDAGIYGPAAPTRTAPLLFDLGQPSLVTNILALVTFSGTTYFTNVDLTCSNTLTLTPQQMNDLNAGLWYVNVTSAAYPGGEIRGQFTSQPIISRPAFQTGNGNGNANENGFGFDVTCAQQNYAVQVSTDLLNWTTFTNVSPTNIDFRVVDTEAATNGPQRFYRVNMNVGGGGGTASPP